jgi:hypothetical protein
MTTAIQVRPTDKTECEICDYKGNNCKSYGTIIMCPECLAREQAGQKELEVSAPERIEAVSKRVEPIGTRAEYFNNKTQSIIDRRKAIEADETIADKNWREAQELMDWLNETKQNLFNLKEQEEKETAAQNAIQVRLSQLANSLRIEQREALKLKDINYKPAEVKSKSVKVSKPKQFDKVAIEAASKQYGIPAGVLQVICLTQKMTVDEAVKTFMNAKAATEKK